MTTVWCGNCGRCKTPVVHWKNPWLYNEAHFPLLQNEGQTSCGVSARNCCIIATALAVCSCKSIPSEVASACDLGWMIIQSPLFVCLLTGSHIPCTKIIDIAISVHERPMSLECCCVLSHRTCCSQLCVVCIACSPHTEYCSQSSCHSPTGSHGCATTRNNTSGVGPRGGSWSAGSTAVELFSSVLQVKYHRTKLG